jgi:Xaa-Pro aminopeptidase
MPEFAMAGLLEMRVDTRLPRLRSPGGLVGEVEALLVTNLVNIRYLTGFTGSAGMLLVRARDAILVTDGRYATQSAEQLAAAGVTAEIEIGSPARQREVIKTAVDGLSRVGLEAGSVTWAAQRTFAGEWDASVELVPTDGVVEDLRRVKDQGEVSRMSAAAAVADEALARIKPMLAARPTEAEVGLALDHEMRRLGASGSSFETIVAAGPNAAKPHARPSSRRIEPGELVVIDFGAVVDGYCSDMTRTVCVGEPASPTRLRMVEVVGASQAAGVAAVRQGVTGVDVDAACREVIAEAGWADAFIHGTGHGVGLDIHEAPWVGTTSTDTLAAGHVVTVEPGVYLPEHGGVRIEDTVVVTDTGCYPLTKSPKDLVIA